MENNIIDGKDLVNMKFIKTEDGLLKEYKPYGKFIPNYDEAYWYINNHGEIIWTLNKEIGIDRYIMSHNLVFRTKEEAEDYKWFLDKLDEYRYEFTNEEWKDTNIGKYNIYYNYNENNIDVAKYSYHKYNTIYFQKRINATNFIGEVGVDRIKKYMFGVWE